MRPGKIILIAVIGFAIIFTVVRDLGLVNLNAYSATHKMSHSDHWTGMNTLDSSTALLKKVNVNDLSVVVLLGRDTIYKQIGRYAPIVVNVTSLDFDPMWAPLYKSTRFTAYANTAQFLDDDQLIANQYSIIRHIEGSLAVYGDLDILGVCSSPTAKVILHKAIGESFASKVRDQFSALPEDFFTVQMQNRVAYKQH